MVNLLISFIWFAWISRLRVLAELRHGDLFQSPNIVSRWDEISIAPLFLSLFFPWFSWQIIYWMLICTKHHLKIWYPVNMGKLISWYMVHYLSNYVMDTKLCDYCMNMQTVLEFLWGLYICISYISFYITYNMYHVCMYMY